MEKSENLESEKLGKDDDQEQELIDEEKSQDSQKLSQNSDSLLAGDEEDEDEREEEGSMKDVMAIKQQQLYEMYMPDQDQNSKTQQVLDRLNFVMLIIVLIFIIIFAVYMLKILTNDWLQKKKLLIQPINEDNELFQYPRDNKAQGSISLKLIYNKKLGFKGDLKIDQNIEIDKEKRDILDEKKTGKYSDKYKYKYYVLQIIKRINTNEKSDENAIKSPLIQEENANYQYSEYIYGDLTNTIKLNINELVEEILKIKQLEKTQNSAANNIYETFDHINQQESLQSYLRRNHLKQKANFFQNYYVSQYLLNQYQFNNVMKYTGFIKEDSYQHTQEVKTAIKDKLEVDNKERSQNKENIRQYINKNDKSAGNKMAFNTLDKYDLLKYLDFAIYNLMEINKLKIYQSNNPIFYFFIPYQIIFSQIQETIQSALKERDQGYSQKEEDEEQYNEFNYKFDMPKHRIDLSNEVLLYYYYIFITKFYKGNYLANQKEFFEDKEIKNLMEGFVKKRVIKMILDYLKNEEQILVFRGIELDKKEISMIKNFELNSFYYDIDNSFLEPELAKNYQFDSSIVSQSINNRQGFFDDQGEQIQNENGSESVNTIELEKQKLEKIINEGLAAKYSDDNNEEELKDRKNNKEENKDNKDNKEDKEKDRIKIKQKQKRQLQENENQKEQQKPKQDQGKQTQNTNNLKTLYNLIKFDAYKDQFKNCKFASFDKFENGNDNVYLDYIECFRKNTQKFEQVKAEEKEKKQNQELNQKLALTMENKQSKDLKEHELYKKYLNEQNMPSLFINLNQQFIYLFKPNNLYGEACFVYKSELSNINQFFDKNQVFQILKLLFTMNFLDSFKQTVQYNQIVSNVTFKIFFQSHFLTIFGVCFKSLEKQNVNLQSIINYLYQYIKQLKQKTQLKQLLIKYYFSQYSQIQILDYYNDFVGIKNHYKTENEILTSLYLHNQLPSYQLLDNNHINKLISYLNEILNQMELDKTSIIYIPYQSEDEQEKEQQDQKSESSTTEFHSIDFKKFFNDSNNFYFNKYINRYKENQKKNKNGQQISSQENDLYCHYLNQENLAACPYTFTAIKINQEFVFALEFYIQNQIFFGDSLEILLQNQLYNFKAIMYKELRSNIANLYHKPQTQVSYNSYDKDLDEMKIEQLLLEIEEGIPKDKNQEIEKIYFQTDSSLIYMNFQELVKLFIKDHYNEEDLFKQQLDFKEISELRKEYLKRKNENFSKYQFKQDIYDNENHSLHMYFKQLKTVSNPELLIAINIQSYNFLKYLMAQNMNMAQLKKFFQEKKSEEIWQYKLSKEETEIQGYRLKVLCGFYNEMYKEYLSGFYINGAKFKCYVRNQQMKIYISGPQDHLYFFLHRIINLFQIPITVFATSKYNLYLEEALSKIKIVPNSSSINQIIKYANIYSDYHRIDNSKYEKEGKKGEIKQKKEDEEQKESLENLQAEISFDTLENIRNLFFKELNIEMNVMGQASQDYYYKFQEIFQNSFENMLQKPAFNSKTYYEIIYDYNDKQKKDKEKDEKKQLYANFKEFTKAKYFNKEFSKINVNNTKEASLTPLTIFFHEDKALQKSKYFIINYQSEDYNYLEYFKMSLIDIILYESLKQIQECFYNQQRIKNYGKFIELLNAKGQEQEENPIDGSNLQCTTLKEMFGNYKNYQELFMSLSKFQFKTKLIDNGDFIMYRIILHFIYDPIYSENKGKFRDNIGDEDLDQFEYCNNRRTCMERFGIINKILVEYLKSLAKTFFTESNRTLQTQSFMKYIEKLFYQQTNLYQQSKTIFLETFQENTQKDENSVQKMAYDQNNVFDSNPIQFSKIVNILNSIYGSTAKSTDISAMETEMNEQLIGDFKQVIQEAIQKFAQMMQQNQYNAIIVFQETEQEAENRKKETDRHYGQYQNDQQTQQNNNQDQNNNQ